MDVYPQRDTIFQFVYFISLVLYSKYFFQKYFYSSSSNGTMIFSLLYLHESAHLLTKLTYDKPNF